MNGMRIATGVTLLTAAATLLSAPTTIHAFLPSSATTSTSTIIVRNKLHNNKNRKNHRGVNQVDSRGFGGFVTCLAASSLTPQALGTEGDWTAYLDEDNTGLVYYFNGRTGESLWEPPTPSFPVVVLSRDLRRKAETKRSEYIRNLRDREARQNFPEANTARTEEEAKRKREQQLLQQQQQKNPQQQKNQQQGKNGEWFDFLFEEEPEPEPTWFDTVSSVLKKGEEVLKKGEEVLKKGGGESSDATSVVAEQSTAEKAEQVAKQEQKTKQETTDEQLVAAEKVLGLFERFAVQQIQPPINGEAATTTKTKSTTTTTPPEPEVQVEATKTVEKKPTIRRSISFPLWGSTTTNSEAAPTTTTEGPKTQEAEETKTTVEKKPAIRRSITFPLWAQQAPAPVAEPEPMIWMEPVVTPIQIEAASCVLPHPAKMFWGGEDAVFTAGRTFGVFDGVTGASKLDGVPLYSKTLAYEMRKATKNSQVDANGMSLLELQRCLVTAKEVADASSTGASTAIVASITQDGFLRALNIGDSACLVIRNGKAVARTREISHYFDCPYQLSMDSPDKPRDGTKLNIELVRGDIIVMGSDGVFDNLDDSEIVDLVVDCQQKNAKLSSLAKRISDRSRKVSLNRNASTPYARQAKRNGDPDFSEGVGGKVDDVSCVVVRYA